MSNSNDPQQTDDDTSAENFAALRDGKAAVERELAFTKAGIDTDSPQGKVLMQTFDGKLDKESIQAYRDSIFGAPTTPEKAPAADPQKTAEGGEATEGETGDPYARDVAGQQAMRDVLAGSGQPGAQPTDESPTKDTYADAFEQYHAERKAGVSLERAQLAAIDRVIAAGASGVADVQFDPAAWEREKAEHGHRPKEMQGS